MALKRALRAYTRRNPASPPGLGGRADCDQLQQVVHRTNEESGGDEVLDGRRKQHLLVGEDEVGDGET